MPQLIAKRSFAYNGRRINAGDMFETKNARDAKLLCAVKKAEQPQSEVMPTPPPPPPPAPEPQVPEPVAAEEDDPAAPRRRTYRRRDMTAESPTED